MSPSPESGPNILFFSGGTALRGVSRALLGHTHNSTHIITPFDSGGSSAVIREAFDMPAVGDIRNRLMALADLSVVGNREMYALFTYRLSKKEPPIVLLDELRRMASGEHVLISLLPESKQSLICQYFKQFLDFMPADFDLRGASVGNIVLTAGYLVNGRALEQVLTAFSYMAQVRGTVLPVVEKDMHLAAELADGSVVVGQHRMTGKEAAPLVSKIQKLWLTNDLEDATPATVSVASGVENRIKAADLICYPVGSFYSSVVANLLPQGVGKAVAANPCPKVFIPNPGHDPELVGHSVADQVARLQEYLIASGAPDADSVLDVVLVDTEAGGYSGGFDKSAVEKLGVNVVDRSLASDKGAPCFDADKLVQALLSFI